MPKGDTIEALMSSHHEAIQLIFKILFGNALHKEGLLQIVVDADQLLHIALADA